MRGREREERQQVLLGRLEQLGDPRCKQREALDDLADTPARLGGVGGVGGVEDFAQRGGDEASLGRAAVAVHVADEVDGAALPRRVEDPDDRVLEALMVVRDDEAKAVQAAGPEVAKELRPERLALDLADIEADHLAVPASATA